MARWELIAKNVKYTRHHPRAEFIADAYWCTNCHNRVSSIEILPTKCPWCGASMTDELQTDCPRK